MTLDKQMLWWYLTWKWRYWLLLSRSVVSDSVWPHRWQPTRLLCPWDFPGKSTGVGCHCLLQKILLSDQITRGRSTAFTLSGSLAHLPTPVARGKTLVSPTLGIRAQLSQCCGHRRKMFAEWSSIGLKLSWGCPCPEVLFLQNATFLHSL